MDAVTLARLQFALTAGFHYLFPPLSIGLSWMMVIMEGMYLRTGNKEYEHIARFWTNIFAVVFAMGVATGIVLEFEFGTNWARYSRYVGDVFGSALAAEGIFAFFLESGFLALLVFGWDRVSPKLHFFSTVMVSLGALFSSIWIVVANSWQQTPAGHHVVQMMKDGEPWFIDGEPVMRAEIVNFWEMVFNPSSVPRLLHVWAGAGTLGAFFVLSISAYYILRGKHLSAAKKMFHLALAMAVVMTVANILTGHYQAVEVAEQQPAKLAAMEGHFETGDTGAIIYVWGFPDEEARKVHFGVGIPYGLSLLTHFDASVVIPGLDQFPEADWPPVALTFYMFHVMVGLGFAFTGLALLALYFWWRGTLFDQRWLLWVFVFAVAGPYITNEFGWGVAEVGRQPWIVYNELRTTEATSTAVSAREIWASMFMFVTIYAFLFAVWIYVMNAKIQAGPAGVSEEPRAGQPEGGWVEAATRLADPTGPSMTRVREGVDEDIEGVDEDIEGVDEDIEDDSTADSTSDKEE